MRLSDDNRDDDLSVATIAAAVDAGVTVFDTARAYGRGAEGLGHNEALLARALRTCGAPASARIVTKGGMTRARGGWVPDGRARAILGDCEASLIALDGLPIDLYLLHAPDLRTPWRTSVRALARLLEDGVVAHVGVANVNRPQLDEALALASITAVQVAVNPFDRRAIRGGLVDYCESKGIAVIAHSPLGGPRRAGGLARQRVLVDIAHARAWSAPEVALAWLLDLSPAIVAIPGARRPETARSAAGAAGLHLDPADRAVLARTLGGRRPPRAARPRWRTDTDVVVIMGIPGAGKTRFAEKYVARDYVRLNRDDRGGSLLDLAEALDGDLATGTRRVVLDNTWLTRAARSHVIEAGARHRVPVRCVWIDTPLAQAQVNVVERLLERFGSLPTSEELRAVARHEPGALMPTSQMRALRDLEPPSGDEGWASVEHVAFERVPTAGHTRAGRFVAAAALTRPGWQRAIAQGDRTASHLVFDWRPGATRADLDADLAILAAEVPGAVAGALCPHAPGPPTCWCRPPLPGLVVSFAKAEGIDLPRSVVVGTASAHQTLATTLGTRFVRV